MRPVGWRWESYRHSLASRGIPTRHKYFVTMLPSMMSAAMYHEPPKSLMNLIPPAVQEKALEEYYRDMLTAQELADRYNVKWQDPRSITERKEYAERMTFPEKKDAVRKLANELGRPPKVTELPMVGMNPSTFAAYGGYVKVLNDIVKESIEADVNLGLSSEGKWYAAGPRPERSVTTIAQRRGFAEQELESEKQRKVRDDAEKRVVEEKVKHLLAVKLKVAFDSEQATLDDFNEIIAGTRMTRIPFDELIRQRDAAQKRVRDLKAELVQYEGYYADKGIVEKYKREFPDLVRKDGMRDRFPGEAPRITREYARFRQASPDKFVLGSFRTKKVGDVTSLVLGKKKESGKFEVQSVLVKRHPNYWVMKKGWGDTDGSEGAREYIRRNVESHAGNHRLEHFTAGIKQVLLHPWKDLDGEWQEYTSIAENDVYGPKGRSEPLSKEMMGRWTQRGAALFGRVASQANVEPLIDGEKDRNLREAIMDIEFGRRM